MAKAWDKTTGHTCITAKVNGNIAIERMAGPIWSAYDLEILRLCAGLLTRVSSHQPVGLWVL